MLYNLFEATIWKFGKIPRIMNALLFIQLCMLMLHAIILLMIRVFSRSYSDAQNTSGVNAVFLLSKYDKKSFASLTDNLSDVSINIIFGIVSN